MNLWSHRFSQNINKKLSGFLPYSIQGRNSEKILFIFMEKWWLHKFILKFTDLYGTTIFVIDFVKKNHKLLSVLFVFVYFVRAEYKVSEIEKKWYFGFDSAQWQCHQIMVYGLTQINGLVISVLMAFGKILRSFNHSGKIFTLVGCNFQ